MAVELFLKRGSGRELQLMIIDREAYLGCLFNYRLGYFTPSTFYPRYLKGTGWEEPDAKSKEIYKGLDKERIQRALDNMNISKEDLATLRKSYQELSSGN